MCKQKMFRLEKAIQNDKIYCIIDYEGKAGKGMFQQIGLPKLNGLSPTPYSTLLKLMEEAGELARATMAFLPYERLKGEEIEALPAARAAMRAVSGELLDVAQTCVTMIFVMEERHALAADGFVRQHLEKLRRKGYRFDDALSYRIDTANGYKYLALPRLQMEEVTLLTTVCKIQEEIGELTQCLGKHSGASGERCRLDERAVLAESAAELLDVAQCCFTMMYLLAERYEADIEAVVAAHIGKLRARGYCA